MICSRCQAGECSHRLACSMMIRGIETESNFLAYLEHPDSGVWYRCDCLRRPIRCVCAGQGGSVYSAMCPIHDPAADQADPAWQRWYAGHLAEQERIVERLGWNRQQTTNSR